MKRDWYGITLAAIFGFMLGAMAMLWMANYRIKAITAAAQASGSDAGRTIQQLAELHQGALARASACDDIRSEATMLLEPSSRANPTAMELSAANPLGPVMKALIVGGAIGGNDNHPAMPRWLIPYKVKPYFEGQPNGSLYVWIKDGKLDGFHQPKALAVPR
jgi:hypothetical protein